MRKRGEAPFAAPGVTALTARAAFVGVQSITAAVLGGRNSFRFHGFLIAIFIFAFYFEQ